MIKVLIILIILVLFGAVAYNIFGNNYGKIYSQCKFLLVPRVTDMADQKVIE